MNQAVSDFPRPPGSTRAACLLRVCKAGGVVRSEAILLAEGQKSAVAEYCPNHGKWPENFVIPAKAEIQVCRHGNLSGKKVSPVLSPGFPLSWE
ncbi:hypothetical protein G3Q35_002081 [Neisseria gonorrhoeae]